MKRALVLMAIGTWSCGGRVYWGPHQSVDCAAFIACSERLGAPKGSLDEKYGPMGECWRDATASPYEFGYLCEQECKLFGAKLRADHPDAGCKKY